VSRIFLTLAACSNLSLAITYILGWTVLDPQLPQARGLPLGVHMLSGLGALLLTLLVHAIVLTYFMGTGRWIEETSQAYRLGIDARDENIRLKYQTLPGMVGCLLLLIVTAAFGAAADPGAGVKLASARTIHFWLACLTLAVNLLVNWWEYATICRNGRVIEEILGKVQALRQAAGLDRVSSAGKLSRA
jgi:hypothetical protein